MEYTDDAFVKVGSFRGDGDITYLQESDRFIIRKKPSSSGKGAVVGAMFGVLGQALMNHMSEWEQLAAFSSGEIRLVKMTEKKRVTEFSLYSAGAGAPYEVRLNNKCEMNSVLRRVLANKMEGAAPVLQPVPPVRPPEPILAKPVERVPEPISVQPIAQPTMPAAVPQPRLEAAPQIRKTGVVLSLRTGPLAGKDYCFAPGSRVVIGRSPSRCTLLLPQYVNVSGTHCSLEIGERSLRVTDLNSTNGTYVNGARLQPNQPAMLRAGDVLKLANDVCIFQISFQ